MMGAARWGTLKGYLLIQVIVKKKRATERRTKEGGAFTARRGFYKSFANNRTGAQFPLPLYVTINRWISWMSVSATSPRAVSCEHLPS